MKIARITGTVTATIKNSQLSGIRLLVADIEDGNDDVLEKSLVVSDTCSAGNGDLVLITTGSAARMTGAGIPVDAAVVAIIDHLEIDGGKSPGNTSLKRKKEMKWQNQ